MKYELFKLLAQSNPLGNAEDLGLPRVEADPGQLDSVLNTVFLVAGALATVFIVVGGLKYVLSTGSPEATKKAKDTVLYAIIGLLITIFAFAIVNFVISEV